MPSPSENSLAERVRLLKTELEQIRIQLETLQEENTQLRELIYDRSWEPPLEFGLTSTEARLLAILYKHAGANSKERIHTMMYDYNRSMAEIPEIKIIDVLICKIRKKLVEFDVGILTHWGQGYALSHEGRKILDNWYGEQSDASDALDAIA